MHPASERRRFIVRSSFIVGACSGWAHAQNSPYTYLRNQCEFPKWFIRWNTCICMGKRFFTEVYRNADDLLCVNEAHVRMSIPINHSSQMAPLAYKARPLYIYCTLQWRHNERLGVSNHRRLDCLLNRLLRRRWKKISKLRVNGLCEGKPPVTGGFPSHKASNAEYVSHLMTSPWDPIVWCGCNYLSMPEFRCWFS